MTHQKTSISSQAVSRGFSLVELLVALVFISLLMAGMLRVYAASLKSFTAANETIRAQRSNRWALDQLLDDFQSASYRFPDSRELPRTPTTGQRPVMIIPNITVTVATANPTGGTSSESLNVDDVQLFMETVVVSTTLAADAASGATEVIVNASVSELAQIQPGDTTVIMGANRDIFPVASLTGNRVTRQDRELDAFGNPTGFAKWAKGLGGLSNTAGTPVIFIRPNQVIHYSIMAMNLDPSNPVAQIPCLMRQQATIPAGGAAIVWAGIPGTVVAENVSGFRVDISIDGGLTWARGPIPATDTGTSSFGAANWGVIEGNINLRLQGGIGVAPYTSISDSAYPFWTQYIPALFRVDITTRTSLQREEFSQTPGALAFRTRRQSVMITPRNFGAGLN